MSRTTVLRTYVIRLQYPRALCEYPNIDYWSETAIAENHKQAALQVAARCIEENELDGYKPEDFILADWRVVDPNVLNEARATYPEANIYDDAEMFPAEGGGTYVATYVWVPIEMTGYNEAESLSPNEETEEEK